MHDEHTFKRGGFVEVSPQEAAERGRQRVAPAPVAAGTIELPNPMSAAGAVSRLDLGQTGPVPPVIDLDAIEEDRYVDPIGPPPAGEKDFADMSRSELSVLGKDVYGVEFTPNEKKADMVKVLESLRAQAQAAPSPVKA